MYVSLPRNLNVPKCVSQSVVLHHKNGVITLSENETNDDSNNQKDKYGFHSNLQRCSLMSLVTFIYGSRYHTIISLSYSAELTSGNGAGNCLVSGFVGDLDIQNWPWSAEISALCIAWTENQIMYNLYTWSRLKTSWVEANALSQWMDFLGPKPLNEHPLILLCIFYSF